MCVCVCVCVCVYVRVCVWQLELTQQRKGTFFFLFWAVFLQKSMIRSLSNEKSSCCRSHDSVRREWRVDCSQQSQHRNDSTCHYGPSRGSHHQHRRASLTGTAGEIQSARLWKVSRHLLISNTTEERERGWQEKVYCLSVGVRMFIAHVFTSVCCYYYYHFTQFCPFLC